MIILSAHLKSQQVQIIRETQKKHARALHFSRTIPEDILASCEKFANSELLVVEST